MKQWIILLCCASASCFADSEKDTQPSIINDQSASHCQNEPLLAFYEIHAGHAIIAANLTTKDASISFTKERNTQEYIRQKLLSEFGEAFLTNACAFDDVIFSIKDKHEGYLGAFEVTFTSDESAKQASEILEDLNREWFQTSKPATAFVWTLVNNTILITYTDAAVSSGYQKDSTLYQFDRSAHGKDTKMPEIILKGI